MSIASRETYETAMGGWADGRLGQAYDLIWEVRQSLADQPEHPARMMLHVLLGSVEAADIEIGNPS